MHDGKTFHTSLWLTSIVLLFKLISCWSVCIQQARQKGAAGDGQVVLDLPHFWVTWSQAGLWYTTMEESSCYPFINFLDVMGRTVKREYHRSLFCIWKALFSHNHKKDFICWGNLIVRYFAFCIYKMTKKEYENPGFFIYRDCPAAIEGEILETIFPSKEAHSKCQKTKMSKF